MIIKIDEEDFQQKLNKSMWGIAIELQESLKEKLTQEHGADTGELKSSIIVKVENNSIIIEMSEQGKYIEFGTPPHMPPVEALQGWVRRKWGAGSKDGDPKNMAAAWRLAYAIKRRGTRPYPFIRPTFNNELIPIVQKNLTLNFK